MNVTFIEVAEGDFKPLNTIGTPFNFVFRIVRAPKSVTSFRGVFYITYADDTGSSDNPPKFITMLVRLQTHTFARGNG